MRGGCNSTVVMMDFAVVEAVGGRGNRLCSGMAG